MADRREYEMTEAQLAKLLESMRPQPYLIANGIGPISVQESANLAWQSLGRDMGFDGMTVVPVRGKGDRFFSAIPKETP
jgi:hypothetical protein